MRLKRKSLIDHDHDKYITTSEFNKLTTENFAARLEQAHLVAKTDFDAKSTSLNKKIKSNKTKHVFVENELKKKLKKFDSKYFECKNHFEEDGTQNYSVFQKIYKYFKNNGNTESISSWESKGLSNEVIKPPSASNNSHAPTLKYTGKGRYTKLNLFKAR